MAAQTALSSFAAQNRHKILAPIKKDIDITEKIIKIDKALIFKCHRELCCFQRFGKLLAHNQLKSPQIRINAITCRCGSIGRAADL